MELKDFVKKSILDIAAAIQEGNEEANEKGYEVLINPYPLLKNNDQIEVYKITQEDEERKEVELIEFDIAVTSTSETDGELGSSIKVAGFKVGAEASVSDGKEHVSRIKFQVPVAFPNCKL